MELFDTTLERNYYRSRLISLVKQNPLLWDKTAMDFNNRTAKIQKWLQVSEELGVSIDKIRRTWENLRDQYRRDLKRQIKHGTKSKWRFYDDMSFIRSMVRIKEVSVDNSDSESEVETANDDYSHDDLSTLLKPHLAKYATTLNTTATNIDGVSNGSICFQPIQLSTDWQQKTRTQERPQQFDNQNQAKYELYARIQQQQEQQLLNHTQQQDKYQQEQQQNKCDSSQEINNVTHLESISEISDSVKIELESDSEEIVHTPQQQQKLSLTPDNENLQIISEPLVSTSVATSSSSSAILSNLKRVRHHHTDLSSIKDEEISSKIPCITTRSHQPDIIEVQDEDYHFMMSILPSLRQVARNRRLPLRMSIMNLISKELNSSETN